MSDSPPERRRVRWRSTCVAWLLLAALIVACGQTPTSADDTTSDVGDATPAADADAAADSTPAADADAAADSTPAGAAAADPDAATAAQLAAPAAPAAPVAWPVDAPPAHKLLYAGTWTIKPPEGFERAWIDETGLRETYTKRAAGRREWAGLTAGGSVLPVDDLLRARAGPAAAYVYVLVQRQPLEGLPPEQAWPDREAVLHLRHQGRVRAFFDGELLIDGEPPEQAEWRHSQARVLLTTAFDVVLLKLGRGDAELGSSFDVELRLSAPDGTPIPGQGWNTMRPAGFLSDLPAPPAPDDG